MNDAPAAAAPPDEPPTVLERKPNPPPVVLADGSLLFRLDDGVEDAAVRPMTAAEKHDLTARRAVVFRETRETKIDLALDLGGSGKSTIAPGVGFFDHLLTLLARHSLIDLTVQAAGDLHVDAHHTV